ncbi:agmatine deiminase family protein [Pendulispora brunnea]|uniref:Agmatine deiminase family protein n=1 Tax=Pendulispora brunnea TaxID=2905690 RepID=A0ABZ2K366_9BACT
MHRRAICSVFCAMLAALLAGCASGAEPSWSGDEEQSPRPTVLAAGDPVDATPPSGYRVPAEYEPVRAVLITWRDYIDVLGPVAAASAAAGARVLAVKGPPSIPGVPPQQYQSLDYSTNSAWVRDYGPVGINEATHTLGMVDTQYGVRARNTADDAIPCKLAATLHSPCYGTKLVFDGGNYMTDGRGNAFLSRRIYEWNSGMRREAVDAALQTYLGARTIHIFDYATDPSGRPADGTGHIDMFAKLVGECKVIVAETSDEPFRSVTEDAANYFRDLACGSGRYQVTRVKGWVSNGTWYTYTNSLIVNRTVIMPFYNAAEQNVAAQRAYESAMPGYRVVGVNSESSIGDGGAIHCLTREIPSLGSP